MASRTIVLVGIYDAESFAVRTLHAVAHRAGFPVRSVFLKQLNLNNTMTPTTQAEIDLAVQTIAEFDPMLVGISVRSTYYQLADRLTRALRPAVSAPILWGGVHVTISPETCIESADAICLGEGEGALLDMAHALERGEPIDSIANLWVRQPDGAVVRNALRPLIEDLDSLPFPDFTGADKVLIDEDRASALGDDGRQLYWVMTSRGCPYRCSYCCNNVVSRIYHGKGPYVRRRSVASVMEELRDARRRFPCLNYVNFEDDVFTFNRAWLKAFSERYREAIGLPFFCYCHPQAVDAEMIALVKRAGVSAMTMGIQSGSQAVRYEHFARRDDNEAIVRAAHMLHDHGVSCMYDIIMDNPLETTADKEATLELLLRLPRPFELHTHTLTHFPATDLTNKLLGRGLIAREDVEDMRQQSYERWTPSLDLARAPEDMFWDGMYYMVSRRRPSPETIEWLSRRRWLRRHPALLIRLLRLTSTYIQTQRRNSRWDAWRIRFAHQAYERLRRWRWRWRSLAGRFKRT